MQLMYFTERPYRDLSEDELAKIIGGVLLIVAITGNQWLAKLSKR